MRTERRFCSAALVPAVLLAGAPALGQSTQLTLYELAAFPLVLDCHRQCEAGPAFQRQDCLAGCPLIPTTWEKDGVEPVEQTDFELAVLEYWADGDTDRICYQGAVVKPAHLCAAGDCATLHPEPGACDDADGDGIPAWQEEHLGTSDSPAANDKQSPCTSNAACGFVATCRYEYWAGQQLCMKRDCGGATCTAFHLAEVESNNQELVAHVYYDYSPVPATVLDLRFLYDSQSLALIDARRLQPLIDRGKELKVTHPATGVLRLVVLGLGSASAIPNGAIVELVFRRTSSQQARVQFDLVDYYQRSAMAPSQGDAQAALAQDALWGIAVQVPGFDPTDAGKGRLLLSYSFDDPARFLDYLDPNSSADKLCALLGNGCFDTATQTYDPLTLAKVQALQAGVVVQSQRIEGVSGKGVYLDGNYDHLELPIALNTRYIPSEQGFSLSAWFYAEGLTTADNESEQVLFSHNTHSEQTRFAVLLVPAAPGYAQLAWRLGPYAPGVAATPIGEPIELLRWTHLGLGVDAATNTVAFYLNGRPAGSAVIADGLPALQCPQIGVTDPVTGQTIEATPKVVLHPQGDPGQPPQSVYFASAKNGIYGIDHMDLEGLSRREVLRDGQTTFQDPDYHPNTGRIVYSSNKSGHYEIWAMDAAGPPKQLTSGFGNTPAGVFARRPRWSRDGAAIVFESNVYTASSSRTDNAKRLYHLYYLPYDASKMLDYAALLTQDRIAEYRLTPSNAETHSHHAVWLRDGVAGQDAGKILYTQSQRDYSRPKALAATIPLGPVKTVATSPVLLAGSGLPGDASVRALDGYEVNPGTGPSSKALLAASWSQYEATAEYTFTTAPGAGGTTEVTVRRNCPSSCAAFEVRDLFVGYNRNAFESDLEQSTPGAALDATGGTDKDLELRDVSTDVRDYVRVEVLSPRNNTPLPHLGEIAKIVLRPKAAGAPGVELFELVSHDRLYVADLLAASGRTAWKAVWGQESLDRVTAAAFSPQGDRLDILGRYDLLLAGIQKARPVLMRVRLEAPPAPDDPAAVYQLARAQKISYAPMAIEGLSWKEQPRFYPCNWVGAFRDPSTNLFQAGFRGGLDELRLHSYVRDPAAFRAEAERGFDWLHSRGKTDLVETLVPDCTGSDSECPPYYLCVSGSCQMVSCDPTSPTACVECDNASPPHCAQHGACTLRPLTVEKAPEGAVTFDWVCSSECSVDTDCFGRQCLNGPCRFCDHGACIECQERTESLGTIQLTYIDGCPDRNSFACEAGSCVTECYSFENNASQYLCDPALEYCHHGRCELFEWHWADLSPGSFSGLGQMQLEVANLYYWIATPQRYKVEIKAYGVGDSMQAPELLVEGKSEGGTSFGPNGESIPVPVMFDGKWFTVGRVKVYNRTKTEADQRAYLLTTPYALTKLRVRLVSPPLENFNAASAGFAETPYRWKAYGSRFMLGYRSEIPWWEVKGCTLPGPACTQRLNDSQTLLSYLYGGQPTVIVTGASVGGTGAFNANTRNYVCSYEGTLEPLNADGTAKKVFFGDIAQEQSHQKTKYCETHACSSTQLVRFDLDPATQSQRGWGLLNCNLYTGDLEGQAASLELAFAPPVLPNAPGVTETENGCFLADGSACYEYASGNVSIDPVNAPPELLHILDIDRFRAFAYDMEFVSHPEGGNP